KAKLTLSSSDNKLITYASAAYDFVFALRGNELGVSKSVDDTNGGIAFGTAVGTGDKVFAVMKLRGQTGTPLVCFLGFFSSAGTVDSTVTGLLKSITSSAAPASGEIKAGAVVSAGAISAYITLDASEFTVKGEANFLYANEKVMGLLILSDIKGEQSNNTPDR
ncbi:MAG: hypothetical protein LBJ20_07925, partial [Candidatus Methanoplasma sp.]|nr:hypothetical protein [Candidatus Methanoplasma sp.]